MDTQIKKNKGGRPSKYTQFHPEIVQLLASTGKTDVEIARLLSINIDTLTEWKKSEEFSVALKEGKNGPNKKVERSLFERACGYEHSEEKIFVSNGEVIRVQTIKKYPPDPVSMIYWLNNREPERWRNKTEVSGTLTIEDTFKKLDDGKQVAKFKAGDAVIIWDKCLGDLCGLTGRVTKVMELTNLPPYYLLDVDMGGEVGVVQQTVFENQLI